MNEIFYIYDKKDTLVATVAGVKTKKAALASAKFYFQNGIDPVDAVVKVKVNRNVDFTSKFTAEKINPTAKQVFKTNQKAQDLYSEYANDSDIWQHGIDSNGKLFFAFLNGNVRRYTRAQFIKMSTQSI